MVIMSYINTIQVFFILNRTYQRMTRIVGCATRVVKCFVATSAPVCFIYSAVVWKNPQKTMVIGCVQYVRSVIKKVNVFIVPVYVNQCLPLNTITMIIVNICDIYICTCYNLLLFFFAHPCCFSEYFSKAEKIASSWPEGFIAFSCYAYDVSRSKYMYYY